MKRPADVDIEDASDKARKLAKPGLVRVDLDEIGFWPDNRGGLGASGYHCHEVAWDCRANKTKLQRYGHVSLIEIPPHMSEKIRKINAELCQTDSFMPKFSAKMKYICADKTHFVHAQKLCKDGNRTLFDQGKVPIKWREGDSEGQLIQDQGPLCQLYSSALLKDKEALDALAGDDNLNATVQWSQDEMQAYGRVHETVERLSGGAAGQNSAADATQVIQSLEMAGLGQFTLDDWESLLALRQTLPTAISKCLQMVQWNACAGRVRVKPSDFGLTAKLDPRAPWAKIGLLLFQYIGNMDCKIGETSSETFGGRKEIVAKKLQPDVIKELVAENVFVCAVDTFIKTILALYSNPTSRESEIVKNHKLLNARAELLMASGRFLLKVGQLVDQEVKKAKAMRLQYSPEQRIKLVKDSTAGKFHKMEENFRKILLQRSLYTESSLPGMKYPAPQLSEKSSMAPSQSVKKELPHSSVARQVEGQKGMINVDGDELTEVHVFQRLNIKECGERVLAYIAAETPSAVKEEIPDAQSQPTTAGEATQTSEGSWREVRLMKLLLPNAEVELVVNDKPKLFAVSVDDIRAISKIAEVRVVLHPSLQEVGEVLHSYDYDTFENEFIKTVAWHNLQWANASTTLSVEGVQVSRLSEKGKLPIMLQVRATRAFKKGTLILTPARGEILLKETQGVKALAPSQGVVHEAMLTDVDMTVVNKLGPERRGSEGDNKKKSAFMVRSPVLAGKAPKNRESCLENLPPFWALLRCTGPRAHHNMELSVEVFRDTGIDIKASTFPKVSKGVEFLASFPIARNVTNISAGEVLCLPCMYSNGA